MLNPTNSDTRFLNSLMSELSLILVNTGASHHTNINTWIDTIFVDECDTLLKYDRFLPPFPSRHDIITTHDINSYLQTQDWSIFKSPNDVFDIDQVLLNQNWFSSSSK